MGHEHPGRPVGDRVRDGAEVEEPVGPGRHVDGPEVAQPVPPLDRVADRRERVLGHDHLGPAVERAVARQQRLDRREHVGLQHARAGRRRREGGDPGVGEVGRERPPAGLVPQPPAVGHAVPGVDAALGPVLAEPGHQAGHRPRHQPVRERPQLDGGLGGDDESGAEVEHGRGGRTGGTDSRGCAQGPRRRASGTRPRGSACRVRPPEPVRLGHARGHPSTRRRTRLATRPRRSAARSRRSGRPPRPRR